jgi:hypothetical protein
MKNKIENQEFVSEFSKKKPIVELNYSNSILEIFLVEQACRPGADAAAGASSP